MLQPCAFVLFAAIDRAAIHLVIVFSFFSAQIGTAAFTASEHRNNSEKQRLSRIAKSQPIYIPRFYGECVKTLQRSCRCTTVHSAVFRPHISTFLDRAACRWQIPPCKHAQTPT
jgi:hypothetical protein